MSKYIYIYPPQWCLGAMWLLVSIESNQKCAGLLCNVLICTKHILAKRIQLPWSGIATSVLTLQVWVKSCQIRMEKSCQIIWFPWKSWSRTKSNEVERSWTEKRSEVDVVSRAFAFFGVCGCTVSTVSKSISFTCDDSQNKSKASVKCILHCLHVNM